MSKPMTDADIDAVWQKLLKRVKKGEPMSRNLTVREFAEEMLKDETPKARAAYGPISANVHKMYSSFGPEGATCAIGGVALRRKINPSHIARGLQRIHRDGIKFPRGISPEWERDTAGNVFDVITVTNDQTQMTKEEIGRKILAEADEKTLNTVIDVERSEKMWGNS